MASKSLNGILQHLRQLAAVQAYQGLADKELLERFVNAHDEAAFTVLIDRHGAMVLGVCRRALANFHDAEDACQATFLVLASRAPSIRKKVSLGSWLHGVACRVAASAKRDHARRKSRESATDVPAAKNPADEVTWREMQAILDEELQRLPERHRTPLILCYLECRTRDEAAQQLSISSAALRGRLERARNLLRDHLAGRGLTLPAVLSAATLAEGLANAAPTSMFAISSTRAAMILAAGQPLTENVVAAKVISLTREVLQSMFLTKLKFGIAALMCACLMVSLIGSSFSSLLIAQDPTQDPTRAGKPGKSSEPTESDVDFIRRLSKDLRGREPTPTEIHFYVTSKESGKRQKLIDLFIQELQAGMPSPQEIKKIPAKLIKYPPQDDQIKIWKLVDKELRGKIDLAVGDCEGWRERASWSKRMSRLGYVSKTQADSDQANLEKAEMALKSLLDKQQTDDLIQSPDILRIVILSSNLLTSDAQRHIEGLHLVRSDGTIRLGAYGNVSVSGMRTDQAAAAIEKHLAERLPNIKTAVILQPK